MVGEFISVDDNCYVSPAEKFKLKEEHDERQKGK